MKIFSFQAIIIQGLNILILFLLCVIYVVLQNPLWRINFDKMSSESLFFFFKVLNLIQGLALNSHLILSPCQ